MLEVHLIFTHPHMFTKICSFFWEGSKDDIGIERADIHGLGTKQV